MHSLTATLLVSHRQHAFSDRPAWRPRGPLCRGLAVPSIGSSALGVSVFMSSASTAKPGWVQRGAGLAYPEVARGAVSSQGRQWLPFDDYPSYLRYNLAGLSPKGKEKWRCWGDSSRTL